MDPIEDDNFIVLRRNAGADFRVGKSRGRAKNARECFSKELALLDF